MKIFITLFIVILLPISLLAQSNREDVDIIQSVLGKEKKTLMAEFIQLDPTTKDAFWKLYDEFETSRKALGRKRISLLEKYVAGYGTLDDASIDALMKETQSLQGQTDKLVIQYYGKIKKAAGIKPAAQFYQLECYLLTMVRSEILDGIPFIGELEN